MHHSLIPKSQSDPRRSPAIPLLAGLLVVLALSGCQALKSDKSKGAAKVSTLKQTQQAVAEQQPQYKWMNADVKLKAETPSRSLSGKGYLKVRKDSLMWLTVSPALGIEVMRAQITRDSVKVLDRVNNRYRRFAFRRINQMLNPAEREFTFDNLSHMLTGQPVYTPNDQYQLVSADSSGVAMTYQNKVFEECLTLFPALLKTQRYELEKPATDQSLKLTYQDYQAVGRYQLPGTIVIEAKRPQPVTLTVELKNISFEEKDQVSFSVPKSYE